MNILNIQPFKNMFYVFVSFPITTYTRYRDSSETKIPLVLTTLRLHYNAVVRVHGKKPAL